MRSFGTLLASLTLLLDGSLHLASLPAVILLLVLPAAFGLVCVATGLGVPLKKHGWRLFPLIECLHM